MGITVVGVVGATTGVGDGEGVGVGTGIGVAVGTGFGVTFFTTVQMLFFPDFMQRKFTPLYVAFLLVVGQLLPATGIAAACDVLALIATRDEARTTRRNFRVRNVIQES